MAPSDQTSARYVFRRRLGAYAVVLFPLVLLAADLAAPSFAHGRELAAALAEHPDRTWLFVALRMATSLVLIAATAAIVAATPDRGRRWANAAGLLAVLGALGQAHDAAYQVFVLSLSPMSPADAGDLLLHLDRLGAPMELPLLLAFAVSMVLLVVAAWRGGHAAGWAPLAGGAAFLAHFVPGSTSGLVADLLLVAAFVPAGIRLLGEAPVGPDGTADSAARADSSRRSPGSDISTPLPR